MAIYKGKQIVKTLDQWRDLAPPKSDHHWVPGRSAQEVARAWLAGGPKGLPEAVANIVERHADFGAIESWVAEPEAKLKFDNFRGEPCNGDIFVEAKDSFGKFVMVVEAKADETFGNTVGQQLVETLERRLQVAGSNGFRRLEQLAVSILGGKTKGSPSVSEIRYQLLTATAAALAAAHRNNCNRAIVLVHEFITTKTADEKHLANEQDLDNFHLRLSSGTQHHMLLDTLFGPYFVPGAPLFTRRIGLYLGKIRTNLRAAS